MAIEFEHKGETYRVDTVAEMREVKAELERMDRDPERQFVDRVLDFWTPTRFMGVMMGLHDSQRNLLLAIYRHPNLTGRELTAALGLDSEFALAGVISGLSKQLEPLKVDLEQVLTIKVKWTGKSKTRRFMLEDFFVSAGVMQGWPEAWGGSMKDVKGAEGAVKNPRTTKTTKAGE
ncbi:MAG: helix-turn-helix domain-containing protein [Bryobacteraceae bacterium]|nr:helix-turn-helix domain-containing protein [Bryobacteraceae bacterium]